ncbi:MAG: hypothetical protein CSB23_00395 [Deltaproteobacteria bacterium]|nr:MAG: hypothetical protein CSB23_00395 [Deltaproteobacteria bacterium]
MSKETVFNKRLTEETTMDKVEGVLEQFNIPPAAITFIRRHKRSIQASIAVIVVAVVAWSLYGSYVEKRKEAAANALFLADAAPDAEKSAALVKVAEEYKDTSSSLWAEIELAHFAMESGRFDEAAKKYAALAKKLKENNPAKPLVVYGLAQAYEAENDYAEATAQYEYLKNLKGYEAIGFYGLSRLETAQGNTDRAIALLNNFLLVVENDVSLSQLRPQIEKKIARLKVAP